MKKLLLILLCLPMIGFGQCYNSTNIVYVGEGLEGKYVYKSDMEPVNGCVETLGYKGKMGKFGAGGSWKMHRLEIKRGKLIKLMSWYEDGQLKLKTDIIKGNPLNSFCFDAYGNSIKCKEVIPVSFFTGRPMLLN